MEKIEIMFELERTTKNAVRYHEVSEGKPPAVGTLYVQKWVLGEEIPSRLKVVINTVEV